MQDSLHQSFMAMLSVPGLAMNSPEIKRQKKTTFLLWLVLHGDKGKRERKKKEQMKYEIKSQKH